MPLLFQPGTVKNKKTNKNFRPSTKEMIETFFLHVHVSINNILLKKYIYSRRFKVVGSGDKTYLSNQCIQK